MVWSKGSPGPPSLGTCVVLSWTMSGRFQLAVEQVDLEMCADDVPSWWAQAVIFEWQVWAGSEPVLDDPFLLRYWGGTRDAGMRDSGARASGS